MSVAFPTPEALNVDPMLMPGRMNNNPWVEQQLPQSGFQMNSWTVDQNSILNNPVLEANRIAQMQLQEGIMSGPAAYEPTISSMYSVEGTNALPASPYTEGLNSIVPSVSEQLAAGSQGFIANNPIVSEGFINTNNNVMPLGGFSAADQLAGANLGEVPYPQLF